MCSFQSFRVEGSGGFKDLGILVLEAFTVP